MSVSKTAIALIVTIITSLLTLLGWLPEEANEAAQELGLKLEQIVALVTTIIASVGLWFNKIRSGTMSGGLAGLLVKGNTDDGGQQ